MPTEKWRLAVHPAAAAELAALSDAEYSRIRRALALLSADPLRSRPGVDIVKLKDADQTPLFRLRVGKRRAIYAVIRSERDVLVLVIEDRELGYRRLMALASRRLRS